MVRECPIHHEPLETVPAEPVSRCPNCRYTTSHLHFENCPECGRKLQIEAPPPRERCPACEPSETRSHRSIAT